MTRFVVLLHSVGPGHSRTQQDHFDWMFEEDGKLFTFSTSIIRSLEDAIELRATVLQPHRMKYLTYEGPLDNDRGSVRRVIGGEFYPRSLPLAFFSACLSARIGNQNHQATVELHRSLGADDEDDFWFRWSGFCAETSR